MLLNLCAATALMLAIGEVGYKMWKQHNPDPGREASSQATAITNTRPATQYRIEQIIAAHLFGQNVIAQPAAVQAPETRLKLSLLGVVASEDPSIGRALVARQSAPTRSYAVGEIVDQTDAKIHAIESTRVLLERGGRLESLAITRPEMNAAIGTSGPENTASIEPAQPQAN